MALARAERRDLAALLKTLTPEQWDAPSMCSNWRVRDVVAHIVSYEGLSIAGLGQRIVRGGLLPDRVNEFGVKEYEASTPTSLIARVERYEQPQGLTAGFGGRLALTDGMIHQQDIRRPLGLPREIAPERLRVALPFAMTAPPIRGFWHVRGLTGWRPTWTGLQGSAQRCEGLGRPS